jgi:hypothetical protein
MPDTPCETDSQTKNNILSSLRTQLADLLPRAMQRAITSYRQFSSQINPDDPKQFIAFHNACRAALTHVDTLSKLTRWLTTNHPQDDDAQNLQPLLQQARHLLLHTLEFNIENDIDADDTHPEF